MSTLFVNEITVLDFAYLDSERGLLGESWIVDVTLSGDLNDQSFVLDFGIVKKMIKSVLDDYMDHKLCVPTSPLRYNLKEEGESIEFEYSFGEGKFVYYKGPKESVVLVDTENIDPKRMTPLLIEAIRAGLPKNVTGVELELRRESGEGEFYQYCHGLKKHEGNCQRIAHGHRSTIEIERKGESSQELEVYWANRWKGIYLGTREDLESSSSEETYLFNYQSSHGEFTLGLPKSCCEIVPHDSTIECLAQYILDELEAKYPEDWFRVKAFEGVGKGAIAESR